MCTGKLIFIFITNWISNFPYFKNSFHRFSNIDLVYHKKVWLVHPLKTKQGKVQKLKTAIIQITDSLSHFTALISHICFYAWMCTSNNIFCFCIMLIAAAFSMVFYEFEFHNVDAEYTSSIALWIIEQILTWTTGMYHFSW